MGFEMSRSHRKQHYIDSHVQGALLRRIFCHWLVFFGVIALAVILLQTLVGDPSQTLSQRLTHEMGEFSFLAVVMVALLPAFMLDTIRFSNRFVGPIGRVRRHLRQLKEGNTERCKFRGDDFWSALAEEFNSVAELVEAQKAEIEQLKEQASIESTTTA
jgi:nitrogen fixation/metabolism regulation signal transduction histidine kinase